MAGLAVRASLVGDCSRGPWWQTAMTRLRVASYNLLHGIDLSQRGAIDLAAVAGAIAALGADVVGLQEVDRGQERSGGVDQVRELAALLGMSGVFCPALRGSPDRSWTPVEVDDGGAAYGVGLLARRRVTATGRIRLPGGGPGSRGPGASLRRPGWDREPRVALTARVDVDGAELAVAVTHLSYLPWRALRQLRALAAAPGRPPRVLIGDLNLPRRLVVPAVGAWRHAGGGPTYPAWRPRLQMHHVLLDGAVVVEHVAVGTRTTSDHRPLVVDLRLHG